jgi:hypothetical protein
MAGRDIESMAETSIAVMAKTRSGFVEIRELLAQMDVRHKAESAISSSTEAPSKSVVASQAKSVLVRQALIQRVPQTLHKKTTDSSRERKSEYIALERIASLRSRTHHAMLNRIASLYARRLEQISAKAFARAVANGVYATQVNYRAILLRDGGRCHVCGRAIVFGPGHSGESLSFDHVLAFSQGGEHTAENVKCAHMKCNSAKGRKERK